MTATRVLAGVLGTLALAVVLLVGLAVVLLVVVVLGLALLVVVQVVPVGQALALMALPPGLELVDRAALAGLVLVATVLAVPALVLVAHHRHSVRNGARP